MNKNYNPFKAAIESIMEMCNKYNEGYKPNEYNCTNCERLKDFLDNVRVKCKDAFEYDKLFPSDETMEKDFETEYEKYINEHDDEWCREDYETFARHFINWHLLYRNK